MSPFLPILFRFYCRKTSGLKEWAIVELQGDLDVRGNEDMHDQFVGDLYYNKYGQPVRVNTP